MQINPVAFPHRQPTAYADGAVDLVPYYYEGGSLAFAEVLDPRHGKIGAVWTAHHEVCSGDCQCLWTGRHEQDGMFLNQQDGTPFTSLPAAICALREALARA